jgi:hypothetical protein
LPIEVQCCQDNGLGWLQIELLHNFDNDELRIPRKMAPQTVATIKAQHDEMHPSVTTKRLVVDDMTIDELIADTIRTVSKMEVDRETSVSISAKHQQPVSTNRGANPTHVPSIYFAEHADLDLIVGRGDAAHVFYVSQGKLANAAPLFYYDLSDYLQRDLSSDREYTSLPYIGPTAFRIVMLICHYQFHELPRAVKFDTLFHLAEIADQFQVSNLLLPFVRPWLVPYVGHAVESRRYEWILIS